MSFLECFWSTLIEKSNTGFVTNISQRCSVSECLVGSGIQRNISKNMNLKCLSFTVLSLILLLFLFSLHEPSVI